MKKIYTIIIGIMMIFLILGCGKKDPVTAEKFKNIMNSNGYTVVDITSKYSPSQINNVMIAQKDGYQIEFFDVKNIDIAVSSFNTNKDKFEKSKGNAAIQTSKSVGNSSRYTLKANSKYKVVSRIENTFIYINAPSEKVDEIDTILKKLNY